MDIFSFILGPIRPGFRPMAMHYIIFPESIISGCLVILVDTIAMILSFLPIADVIISIGIDEPSVAVLLVVFPKTIVP